MAAPKNFATGFNHNVQHKGQMYHVQTEDSGPENATLSTHLFVGGTILATLRSSYAEIVQAPDLMERVRGLMEAQHKQMLRNLVNGQYDGLGRAVPSYQPGEIATGTLLAHGAAKVHGVPEGSPGPAGRGLGVPDLSPGPAGRGFGVPDLSPGPSGRGPGVPEASPGPVGIREPALRSPPPANGAGGAVHPAGVPSRTGQQPPVARQGQPRQQVPYADGWNHGGTPSWSRPQPQPRAPALASLEPQDKQGFFGDLISEKSLDQVILAYLAGEDDEEG